MDLNYLQIAWGFSLALMLATFSYFLRALTVSGAVGTVLVGTVIFGLGSWTMAAPLLFFFVSASILSKIKSDHKRSAMIAAEKSGPRDLKQVLANGGVACLALIAFHEFHGIFWLTASLAAICEAAADTWATEVGTLRAVDTVSIINFRPIEPGRSGGVSIIGTAAALAGATLTGLAFLAMIGMPEAITLWLVASLAGFAGSMIDSILGATVQARYFDSVNNRYSESKTPGGKLAGGVSWIDNDMVNSVGTLSAAVLAAIFWHIIQIN